tara:strand:- start:13 stop:1056 length:1044 start_codon:yes stop_codon:yes gene_type:complete
MALTNKEGWLYFLGEVDFKSGERHQYVKIGKTDYDRPVSDRSNDHQTGNPRLIVEFADSIRTNFIDDLETYMHHRFSTKRVHGEWFLLDENDLADAVSEANRVNDLLNEVLSEAKEVKLLYQSESNGSTIEPDSKTESFYESFVTHEKTRVMHKLQQDLVAMEMRKLTSSTTGLDGVTTQSIVTRNPKFDKKSFEAAHQDICEKYQKTESKMSKTFAITGKPSAAKTYKELSQDLKNAKEELGEINTVSDALVERDSSIESLHQQWLELHEKEAEEGLMAELYSLKIQHACADNSEIQGVCKWKREIQEKSSLDTAALKENEPELYEKYMIPQPDNIRFSITKYRSY